MSVGFWHHQLYSDLGADTVMESIALDETVVSEAGHPKRRVILNGKSHFQNGKSHFQWFNFRGTGYSD